MSVRSAHATVAALGRRRPAGDPDLAAAREALAVAVAVDQVRRAADALDLAELAEEQRAEVAEIGRRLAGGS